MEYKNKDCDKKEIKELEKKLESLELRIDFNYLKNYKIPENKDNALIKNIKNLIIIDDEKENLEAAKNYFKNNNYNLTIDYINNEREAYNKIDNYFNNKKKDNILTLDTILITDLNLTKENKQEGNNIAEYAFKRQIIPFIATTKDHGSTYTELLYHFDNNNYNMLTIEGLKKEEKIWDYIFKAVTYSLNKENHFVNTIRKIINTYLKYKEKVDLLP